MPPRSVFRWNRHLRASARRMLGVLSTSSTMSQRAHFWLRIAGLTLILVAEFGPRLWAGSAEQPSRAVASAADAR
jgi:hypothetical protein